jgi:glutamate carboxypeptidase
VDNNRKNKVCNFIESQKGEMLDRLERIVNMDSGSRDKADVDKVGRVLKGWWEDEGFEIEEVVYNDLGNCYVARFNQNQPGSKIVLIGHFDTVFSAGEVLARPFRIDGDKAYGPAVGDMKSGLITMLYAVKALKEAGSLNGPVSVVLNSHEEIGSVYSREIIESEAKNAGLAINLEAARASGSVVTGRKGVAFLYVSVEGRAAHAGVEPQKGANANLELAHRIIELQGLNDYDKGLTVNVDVIAGGRAINVIPDSARAEVDVRFVAKADIDALMDYIGISTQKTTVSGTKVKIDSEVMFLPMERKENVISAYNLVLRSADELEVKIEEAFTGGGSDAGFTSQLGIPTICGMGPIGGNPHSVDEYMEVPSLTERCKLLAVTMANFWEKRI